MAIPDIDALLARENRRRQRIARLIRISSSVLAALPVALGAFVLALPISGWLEAAGALGQAQFLTRPQGGALLVAIFLIALLSLFLAKRKEVQEAHRKVQGSIVYMIFVAFHTMFRVLSRTPRYFGPRWAISSGVILLLIILPYIYRDSRNRSTLALTQCAHALKDFSLSGEAGQVSIDLLNVMNPNKTELKAFYPGAKEMADAVRTAIEEGLAQPSHNKAEPATVLRLAIEATSVPLDTIESRLRRLVLARIAWADFVATKDIDHVMMVAELLGPDALRLWRTRGQLSEAENDVIEGERNVLAGAYLELAGRFQDYSSSVNKIKHATVFDNEFLLYDAADKLLQSILKRPNVSIASTARTVNNLCELLIRELRTARIQQISGTRDSPLQQALLNGEVRTESLRGQLKPHLTLDGRAKPTYFITYAQMCGLLLHSKIEAALTETPGSPTRAAKLEEIRTLAEEANLAISSGLTLGFPASRFDEEAGSMELLCIRRCKTKESTPKRISSQDDICEILVNCGGRMNDILNHYQNKSQ